MADTSFEYLSTLNQAHKDGRNIVHEESHDHED